MYITICIVLIWDRAVPWALSASSVCPVFNNNNNNNNNYTIASEERLSSFSVISLLPRHL